MFIFRLRLTLHTLKSPFSLQESSSFLIFICLHCGRSENADKPPKFSNVGPLKPTLLVGVYEHLNTYEVKLLRFAAAGGFNEESSEKNVLYTKPPTRTGITKTNSM